MNFSLDKLTIIVVGKKDFQEYCLPKQNFVLRVSYCGEWPKTDKDMLSTSTRHETSDYLYNPFECQTIS